MSQLLARPPIALTPLQFKTRLSSLWCVPCLVPTAHVTYLLIKQDTEVYLVDSKGAQWQLPLAPAAELSAAAIPDFCLEGEATVEPDNLADLLAPEEAPIDKGFEFHARDILSLRGDDLREDIYYKRVVALQDLSEFSFALPAWLHLLLPAQVLRRKMSLLDAGATIGTRCQSAYEGKNSFMVNTPLAGAPAARKLSSFCPTQPWHPVTVQLPSEEL